MTAGAPGTAGMVALPTSLQREERSGAEENGGKGMPGRERKEGMGNERKGLFLSTRDREKGNMTRPLLAVTDED